MNILPACLLLYLSFTFTATTTSSLSLSLAEQTVADQYETFPYPFLSIEADVYLGLSLPELNHFLWGGRRNFKSTGLNILIAGGGASKLSAVLAQTLEQNNVPGVVVHLDLSNASIKMAKQKAVLLQVAHRIKFVQGSLIDIANHSSLMEHAPSKGFDLVVCTGVLHHLESPSDGLRSLKTVLAPGGGMFIMVYAKYGRNGVYPLQSAFRTMLPLKSKNMLDRVGLTRQLLSALPTNHPLFTGAVSSSPATKVNNQPLFTNSDVAAELYDLLLHSHDVPFTVEDVVALVDTVGLKVVDMVYSAKYNPLTILNMTSNQNLVDMVKRLMSDMNRLETFALGEKLSGKIIKHYFYIVRDQDAKQTHAGLQLNSISLKSASLCRPKGSNLLETIVNEQRDLLVQRLSNEGLEGWYQLYNISMWNTPTPPGAKAIGTYYYRLPPLSAEIAMAAIQNSGNDRCAATIDIFAQVNGRLDGIDLEWELFQEQLHQVILIGESVMQVTVAFPSTWIPPESTLYT